MRENVDGTGFFRNRAVSRPAIATARKPDGPHPCAARSGEASRAVLDHGAVGGIDLIATEGI